MDFSFSFFLFSFLGGLFRFGDGWDIGGYITHIRKKEKKGKL